MRSLKKKLKSRSKEFQFIYGYLDVIEGDIGIRAVVTNKFLDEDATEIYEFFYTIKSLEMN